MKQIFILLFLTLLVNADEVQRLESLISDIDKIQNELQLEKAKNKKLSKELSIYVNNTVNTQIKEEDNPFPTLVMKKKYQNEQGVSYFKASNFYVNKKAKIYDDVDGSTVAIWSDKTLFTSNQRVGMWIKITGIFVNKLWQPANQEQWVKSCDVLNLPQVSE